MKGRRVGVPDKGSIQTRERSLDLVLGDELLLHCVNQRGRIRVPTVDVRACLRRHRARIHQRGCVSMRVEDIVDRVTVARDPAVAEPKVLTDDVLQEVRARAARHAVHRIVAAHDTADVRVPHAALKARREELGQVLSRDDRVECHPAVVVPVLEVVPRGVLIVGDDLEVWRRRKPALEPSDEL